MRILFLLVVISTFTPGISAQKEDLSGIKSVLLFEDFKLNNVAFDFARDELLFINLPPKQPRESVLKMNQPQVSSYKMPSAFFCRIEDAIAKTSKINMKFRLGSVQYVDALEGKGYFEALSNSKATNFHMSRQQKN